MQSCGHLVAHVEPYQACFVQLLPQIHLHPKVVVGVEGHWPVGGVKVVVRVVLVVGGHEAVRAHLQGRTADRSVICHPHQTNTAEVTRGYLVAGVQGSQQHDGPR